jgi:hypothetical protein
MEQLNSNQLLIEKVNQLFKNGANKWNFLNEDNIQIKVYIGVKECDLQIFKIGGLSVNVGFNYANKTKTKNAIIEAIKQQNN